MKKLIKSLTTRQEGFTLVELMVVVAIIGLLSAVAIPNFQKYQARSKTAEAKLQLSALYTAEASFFADYNIYHTCLRYMGFDPREEVSSRYYTVGFTNAANINAGAFSSAQNSGLSDTECGNATLASTADMTHFLAGKRLGAGIATAAFLTGTDLGIQEGTPTMTYTAGAAGIVHKDFTAAGTASLMHINHQKVISNTRNGY
jgi:type IV pilus assembly protein PilA